MVFFSHIYVKVPLGVNPTRIILFQGEIFDFHGKIILFHAASPDFGGKNL